jgi:hypothetical protein
MDESTGRFTMAPPAVPFWTVAPDLSNRWG